MAREFSRELADEVERTLKSTQLKYSYDKGNGCFKLGFVFRGRPMSVDIILMVYKSDLDISCALPDPVKGNTADHEQMLALSEYICRCNTELGCMRFGMDFSNGKISTNEYVECQYGVPVPELIRLHIRDTIGNIEKWMPGFYGITVNGLRDAGRAYELVQTGLYVPL